LNFNKINDMTFTGKRVLLRADFNVSIDEKGEITNDTKIKETLPTIEKLFEKGARQVIIMSHLGRPKEKEEIYKMDKVSQRLAKLIEMNIAKVDDCININLPKDKDIIVLENLRFYPEEKKNDREFAKKLSEHADIYVNDAFGTVHRAHASVHAITQYIPSCAGLLIEKEIEVLEKVLKEPKRPLIAIIGAAKISTKISVLQNLLKNVDKIILGGAIVFTFLKSIDFNIGSSLVEDEYLDTALNILTEHKDKIVIPKDFICCKNINGEGEIKIKKYDELYGEWIGLDVGPESIELFKKELNGAGTIIWNGPLGKFEIDTFGKATEEIGKFITENNSIFTIAAGGDTGTAIKKYNLNVSYISTGGGASLEYLEGKELPALIALKNAKNK
jgi:phosphoglycerate kinase